MSQGREVGRSVAVVILEDVETCICLFDLHSDGHSSAKLQSCKAAKLRISTKYGVRSTSSRSVREKIFPQPVPWKFSSSRSTPYSVSKCRILIARYY